MMCRHFRLEHPRIAAQRSKSRANLENAWHVRFGSGTGITERQIDVRYFPERGHWLREHVR